MFREKMGQVLAMEECQVLVMEEMEAMPVIREMRATKEMPNW